LASLLSLSITKRLKEITIRRILGAKASHIIYLLSSNFLVIISLSLIIGGVLGVWFTQFLLDSIFQIHAGASIYAVFVAAALMLLIIVLTITSRMFGVVHGNPVDNLKSEN
jgi:putative ABC transport system permease protein